MELDGVMTVGVWSWLDSAALREAIWTFSPEAPIRYLNGNGIPDRYKQFRGAAELDQNLNPKLPIRNPTLPPELGFELPIWRECQEKQPERIQTK